MSSETAAALGKPNALISQARFLTLVTKDDNVQHALLGYQCKVCVLQHPDGKDSSKRAARSLFTVRSHKNMSEHVLARSLVRVSPLKAQKLVIEYTVRE